MLPKSSRRGSAFIAVGLAFTLVSMTPYRLTFVLSLLFH